MWRGISWWLVCIVWGGIANTVFAEGSAVPRCVVLNKVNVDEHEILNEDWQRQFFQSHIGKCIDGKMLKAIIAAMSDFYIQRGYITTRPFLKQQKTTGGQINIRVLKGTVEDVVDADTQQPSARTRTAFAFQKGRLLNLKNIETALEMTNRPPSSDARFAIKPGSTSGTSIIEVKYRDFSPWRLKLGLTGRQQYDKAESFITADAAVDNLLGINDTLNFRLNNNRVLRKQRSTRAGELNYAFPISSYLLELTASRFFYKQGVKGINETFIADGRTDGLRLKVGTILMRNQTQKINAALSIYHKNTRNFLEGQLIEVSSYKTTLLQLDITHAWLQRWGSLSTGYSYYRGTDWFGAREDNFYDAQTGTSGQARLQFDKHTLNANLDYRFKDKRYQFTSSAYLQRTSDALFDNDKLSIGGDYTVQGYPEGSLYGNNAWYLRSKMIRSWDANLRIATLESFAGLDYGHVRCEADNLHNCGTLYSVVTGLSSQGRRFTAVLTLGWPLKKLADNFERKATLRLDTTWVF